MLKKFTLASCLFLLLAPAHRLHAAAPVDSTAALALAHQLRPHVSKGKPGPLWAVFDDAMRSAMGDSTRFVAAMEGIHAQTGAITEVLEEKMSLEQGVWMYRATCRFEKATDPLVLLIAIKPDGRVAGLAVRPQPPRAFASTKLDYVTRTKLQLPFRDEWFVFWGGHTLEENRHAVSKAQRFAYDLLIVKGEETHTGDGKKLADYYCYGAEILAPADGVVVETCDSLPDQTPGAMDPGHPAGNHVVIDHGNGEFSMLAHLQPKSVRVKTGDRVKAGDVLGLCGNSGNTTEPHLHYHLQDGPDMGTAEGLPAAFTGLCVDGKPVDRSEPTRGQSIKRCP
jgi:hypothetical protein